MIFSFISGIIFSVIAVLAAAREMRFRSEVKCGKIQSINAVCIGYENVNETDESGNYITVHYPIYEYGIGNTVRQYKRKIGGQRYQIGDKLTLYFNPQTGEIKESMRSINIYIALCCGIMGLIFLIILPLKLCFFYK